MPGRGMKEREMNGRRLDYLGLVAFVTIADQGSFQRAADMLFLSQAALSRRLRKIEDDLGAPLLIRSSRELSLTEAGQDLLPEARRLLKELHDIYDAARMRGRRVKQQMAFACLPSIASAGVSRVLSDFAARRSEVMFRMLDIPAGSIGEKVRSGEAEFGVTIVTAEIPDMRVRPLIEEEYVLVVPSGHDLAGRAAAERRDLEGMPFARINTQSRNRRLIEDTLGQYGERIEWQFEVQSPVSALNIVAAGRALTILPRSALSMAPPGVTALGFRDVRMGRTLGIVTRRGVTLSEPASALLADIEDWFRDFAQTLAHARSAPRPPIVG